MSNVRNEIKAQIVRAGFTMQEVVDRLAEEYDWSDSVSNLSAKLQRESIRYKEVIELADVLGYDIVWQTRRERGCAVTYSLVAPVPIGSSAEFPMDRQQKQPAIKPVVRCRCLQGIVAQVRWQTG